MSYQEKHSAVIFCTPQQCSWARQSLHRIQNSTENWAGSHPVCCARPQLPVERCWRPAEQHHPAGAAAAGPAKSGQPRQPPGGWAAAAPAHQAAYANGNGRVLPGFPPGFQQQQLPPPHCTPLPPQQAQQQQRGAKAGGPPPDDSNKLRKVSGRLFGEPGARSAAPIPSLLHCPRHARAAQRLRRYSRRGVVWFTHAPGYGCRKREGGREGGGLDRHLKVFGPKGFWIFRF